MRASCPCRARRARAVGARGLLAEYADERFVGLEEGAFARAMEEQAEAAAEAMERGAEATVEALAECVYVLAGVYHAPRAHVAESLGHHELGSVTSSWKLIYRLKPSLPRSSSSVM